MDILAIGNSFSEDSTFYLHGILDDLGIENKVVNLYYPGCSFKQHWEHIVKNEKAYVYQENKGTNPHQEEKMVSIDEILNSQKWDIIVSHQASHDSGLRETYEPYIIDFYNYLKENQPQAKLYLQETWAYEIDSSHDKFYLYDSSQEKMFKMLEDNYLYYQRILNVPLIETGNIIQKIRKMAPFDYENGGMSLCRDGFHLHYLYGRYLVALMWAKELINLDVRKSNFIPKTDLTTETVDDNKLDLIKNQVAKFNNTED